MMKLVWYILTISLYLHYSSIYGGIPQEVRRIENDAQEKEPNQLAQPASDAEKKIVHRPSHLEAVPLERDGSLNKEFRREVLLGEDTNNLKNMEAGSNQKDSQKPSEILDPENDKAQLDSLLRQMFKRADKNSDGRLSEEELKQQIIANTKHHLDEAKEESNNIFQTIDENGDGKITWSEYKTHFIVEKGLVDEEHAKDHAVKEHPFDRDSRLMIKEEETAFTAADADGDGLDEVEWLSFRHPEHSKVMLREMTEEIMKAFDKDNNGVLTEEEFSSVHGGDVTDPKMESEYVAARRHEFENMIDKDKDGKATLDELLAFVDPRNERHAAEEVREIMAMIDSDGDKFLTLQELLARAELLSTSGFIHPKARLHDDL